MKAYTMRTPGNEIAVATRARRGQPCSTGSSSAIVGQSAQSRSSE